MRKIYNSGTQDISYRISHQNFQVLYWYMSYCPHPHSCAFGVCNSYAVTNV